MTATEVQRAWDGFVSALAEHAPVSHASLRPPPGDVAAAISRAETDLGLDLGEDLRTLFSLHDGVAEYRWLFPQGALIGVGHALSNTRMMREVWAALEEPAELARASAQPAVTVSQAWLPRYVAVFDDTCGTYGFADLRPGDRHGAIRQYAKGDADVDQDGGSLGGPVARDLVEYVDRVTECLATGRPYPGRDWTLTRENGEAHWH